MSAFVKGKSIAITGGSNGLGLAFIRECLKQGAKNVAILDICDVDNVAGSLQAEFVDQKVIYLKTDVTDRENVKNSLHQAKESFGTIDVVIGNAGIALEKQPEKTILVNLIGVINSTYEAIDLMSTSLGGKGGVIVNISSTLGLDTMNSFPAYAASKHGVIGLMRSLGTDFYANLHGIHFVTICPGFTESRLTTSHKFLDLPWGINSDELTNAILVNGRQSADDYAKVAVNILNEPKNGSIWIVDLGKQLEVEPKPLWRKF